MITMMNVTNNATNANVNTDAIASANRKSHGVARNAVAAALAAVLAVGAPCIAMALPASRGGTSTMATTQQSTVIGDRAALKIALKDAGLKARNCTDVESELDSDDATPHYDVSFKSGGNEYDYDIDAYSGAILTHEVEIDD